MDINQLLSELITKGPGIIFKIVLLIMLVLHLIFSLIMIRQTQMMVRTVEVKISPLIFIASLVQAAFSLYVFIWTIIYL